MFREEKNLYIIDEFLQFNCVAAFTKKSLGNMADYISNENSKINRENSLLELGLENKKIVFAMQKHTNNIIYIDQNDDISKFVNIDNVDGFVTKRKDVAIFTFYADCLPIFILDKENGAFGSAHSGWVGTTKLIIYKLIDEMINKFSSKKENLLIGLGIGIDAQDYEVGLEFYENFQKLFPKYYEKCFEKNNGKIYFNNTYLNELLALDYGILKTNIIVDNRGVKKANTFSHRLDKENVGRSAAIISMKE
ncbi:polyphenol oxidase family protein [Streptobacillus felis]|uniref:polyphenol oxidase family protein n=1 Tax=Streptobacillus felis TaxID=1384509 RepID=UPI00082D1F39|nr:polyphenol oxidase family protein [Streptobacillus felis]